MEALMWDESMGAWADLRVLPTALPHADPKGEPHAVATPLEAKGTRPVWSEAVTARYRERTDLRLDFNVFRVREPAASNYVPLWAGLGGVRHNSTRARLVADSLASSGLLAPGGVLTTLARTPEQWDWPNAWAPLQHMIAVGLNATGEPRAAALGRRVARTWLQTGLAAFSRTGWSYEKYDARGVGIGGGGGEYVPQVGFGWTNGVALDLALGFDFETLEEEE
jgi:alpha,alpha-trehalase